MADDPDNIVLVYLRRFDEKLDRVIDDVRELQGGTTALEEPVVSIRRRMHLLDLGFNRIEKRLDLADLPR